MVDLILLCFHTLLYQYCPSTNLSLSWRSHICLHFHYYLYYIRKEFRQSYHWATRGVVCKLLQCNAAQLCLLLISFLPLPRKYLDDIVSIFYWVRIEGTCLHTIFLNLKKAAHTLIHTHARQNWLSKLFSFYHRQPWQPPKGNTFVMTHQLARVRVTLARLSLVLLNLSKLCIWSKTTLHLVLNIIALTHEIVQLNDSFSYDFLTLISKIHFRIAQETVPMLSWSEHICLKRHSSFPFLRLEFQNKISFSYRHETVTFVPRAILRTTHSCQIVISNHLRPMGFRIFNCQCVINCTL